MRPNISVARHVELSDPHVVIGLPERRRRSGSGGCNRRKAGFIRMIAEPAPTILHHEAFFSPRATLECPRHLVPSVPFARPYLENQVDVMLISPPYASNLYFLFSS